MIETSALGSVNYTFDTESCVDVPQSNYVKALILIFLWVIVIRKGCIQKSRKSCGCTKWKPPKTSKGFTHPEDVEEAACQVLSSKW